MACHFSDECGRQRMNLVCGVVLLLLAVGCGSNQDPRGDRVAAQGTVLIDGEPLPEGRILFVCDQGAGAVKATAYIQDGSFRFDSTVGPLVGQARVEIRPVEMELEELEAALRDPDYDGPGLVKTYIPPTYNSDSKLTADVSDSPDNNTFEFQLVSDQAESG